MIGLTDITTNVFEFIENDLLSTYLEQVGIKKERW